VSVSSTISDVTISGLNISGLGSQDDSIMKVSLWVRQFPGHARSRPRAIASRHPPRSIAAAIASTAGSR
jgi:hypothetical protein